jgi:tetratricopeptide (TPR) repeat protein
MSDFDQQQARREVAELHRLAMEAYQEAQYATAGRLLEQATATAERLGDLPLQVKERYWLAEMCEGQGKVEQAAATYAWIIGLSTDPAQSGRLADENSSWYVAGSFMGFAGTGRCLPDMPVDQLLRVVSDGLEWMDSAGKREWASGLRQERAKLLWMQGDVEGARRELEVGLALKRRHSNSPGSDITSFQLDLAFLLREEFKAHEEAGALVEDVLASTGVVSSIRCNAYGELAITRLEQGRVIEAEAAASECLALAQRSESPRIISYAYELMGRVHRDLGRLDEALVTAAQRWRWSRRSIAHGRFFAVCDLARVRLLQVREACGLPIGGKDAPPERPGVANTGLARRRLKSARRFLRKAEQMAVRLDGATSRSKHQKDVIELVQQADKLAAVIS